MAMRRAPDANLLVSYFVHIDQPAQMLGSYRPFVSRLGDNFPTSALITVAHLARPGMLIEVQAIAVLG
jgi:enamine deaminase RidA (YjgF/YER057c/UK114 family)